MLATLSRNWGLLVLRGVLAILFGILTFAFPGLTLLTLVFMFGAYAVVDGVVNILAAINSRTTNERWWVLLLEGVVSVIAGVLTFVYPAITELILLYFIAFWAIATGVLELIAAIQLRQQIDNEVLLGLAGILSILFGIVLIIYPGAGALTIVWMIGAYAIIFGVVLILLGLRVRNHPNATTPTTGQQVSA